MKHVNLPRADSAHERCLRNHAIGWTIDRMATSCRPLIVAYHAVSSSWRSPLAITESALRSQLGYLHRSGYVGLTFADAERRTRDGTLPRRSVVVTFDDGYADNLPAARVLHQHGLSATFYITAGCLHGEAPFWPSEVRYLVARASAGELRLRMPDQTTVLPLANGHDRQKAVRAINKLMKSNVIPVREDIRRQLREAAGHPELPRHMLTWAELAEMRDLGMTIGAHTCTHANLPSAGLADATREITESKARLERELAMRVTMFSYPNGGAERYITPELKRIVADSGFAAAASSQNAFAGVHSDIYALERVEVEERLEDLVFALEVERFAFAPR